MWGKHSTVKFTFMPCRITPTCVGKAAESCTVVTCTQDHPHMCGESQCTLHPLVMAPGSPPHVWGKPDDFPRFRVYGRITPTCVGKTINVFNVLPIIGDHPHMCGENSSHTASQRSLPGSPPHVWGKHPFN